MKTAIPAIFTTGLVLIPSLAIAQVTETGFLDRTLTLDGQDYSYQVYVPRDYQPSENWPTILFLHGAGENGDEGLKQTHVGLGRAIRFNPERWPAIVVFPQGPGDEELSWHGDSSQIAMNALDQTIEEFSIDESRVYLTGLSTGGEGSWYLGYEYPERFAAIVPICGFVDDPFEQSSFLPESSTDLYADLAERIQDIPIWIFHGDEDNVVPIEESRRMATALEAISADVQYSELKGVDHSAWDPAYADEALATWLFEQQK
ncbi:MAG: prolyl oligopeptidase family serine peptidase [Leptolyngbya sp. SIO3F4]|nr:prolyl oligopeptidase family serine peptidase [Leptolyngbya sp. SIO3F4]